GARTRASGSRSSTSVPWPRQRGHQPSQRDSAWPQAWQTQAVRGALSTIARSQVDKPFPGRHDAAVFEDQLAALDAASLRRRLRPLASGSDVEVLLEGHRVLLLCSNNYLGL